MYIFKFLACLFFTDGVLIPFFTLWGKLSFIQIMFLQSWCMIWIFLLEVPTGVVADYFGRKQSLVLACAVNAIAVLIYGSFPNFYIFMLAEFLFALSLALFSGADEAFTYDTLKKIGKSDKSKKVFGRLESFKLAGFMTAAPIGSIVGSYFGLNAPMLLTALPLSLAFIIGLTFKEPKTTKKTESKRYMVILKEGVKFFYNHKILKILALDLIFIGIIAHMILWVYQPMLKQAGVPILYFGIIHSACVGVEIAIMNSFGKLEKMLGSKKRLIFLSSMVMGSMLFFGGLTTFTPLVILAIILSFSFGLSRRPLFSSYLNKYIESENRATVLSAVSMIEKFATAIIYPVIGLLLDWSLNWTLIILGTAAIIFAFLSRVKEEHLID